MLKTFKYKSNTKSLDYPLLICLLILVIFGLLMLFSASTVVSFKNFGNTHHYFVHQLLHGFLPGIFILYLFSRINYRIWEKILPGLIILSLALLALVKFPGLGLTFGGATRWIDFGPVVFQPAELAKLTLIIYTASWVNKKNLLMNNFYSGLLPYFIILFLFAGLILWQPDLGTVLVLVASSLVVLFLGGVSIKTFLKMGVWGIVLLGIIIKLEPYRLERLTTFLNPGFDPQGAGYQINQALLAVGAGQWFGYGYGLSRQKHYYLPEVIGDSIFAVIAEELGLVIICGFILLLLIIFLRGIYISLQAEENFGKLLGGGLISLFLFQAFINIGAIIGLMPLTGVTLPLVSYGSSSYLMTMASFGIILSVSRNARK